MAGPQTFASVDFSAASVQARGATFTSGTGMRFNAKSGSSWLLETWSQGCGFQVTFDLAGTPTGIILTLTDCTSSLGSGGGYSPIDIRVNGTLVAQNFDPAKAHGGSIDYVVDEFAIPISALITGTNTIMFTAGARAQTNYWIRRLELKR